MIPLILSSVAGLCIVGVTFVLGFRLGGDQGRSRLSEVRLEGARARRQMHELTRQAFVAMTEEAQRRKPPSTGGRTHNGR
jgi:hypothetical protein